MKEYNLLLNYPVWHFEIQRITRTYGSYLSTSAYFVSFINCTLTKLEMALESFQVAFSGFVFIHLRTLPIHTVFCLSQCIGEKSWVNCFSLSIRLTNVFIFSFSSSSPFRLSGIMDIFCVPETSSFIAFLCVK